MSACINTNNAKNIGILNNTIQIQQHQIETGEAGVKSDRAKTTLGELLSNPSNPHQGREFYWNGAMEENLFFKRKACQKKRLSIGAATQPTDLKTGKKNYLFVNATFINLILAQVRNIAKRAIDHGVGC